MANKINDTEKYPNTTPARDDHVIGTDVSNKTNASGGETVTFTLGDIADLGNETDTLFVDASTGRVGINTTSPASLLEVSDTTGATIRINSTKDGTWTAGELFGALEWYGEDVSGSGAGVRASIEAQSAKTFGVNGMLVFKTLKSGSTLAEQMVIDEDGNVGIGTSAPSALLDVNGSLSKNSGSFKIDHPLKPDTHHLVHSFVEGPQADNLYRGKAVLVDGQAVVNLDEAGRMTEGTFVALNGNVQCWTTNEDGWTQVRGKISGNILTIESQDPVCTDEVSWLVIGERHDQHIIDTKWTDENGRVITEPAKENAQ